MHETIKQYIQAIGDSIEVIGIAAIIIGFIFATVLAAHQLVTGKEKGHVLFRDYRQNLARSILSASLTATTHSSA